VEHQGGSNDQQLFSAVESLAELRQHQPDFAKDQLSRCAQAVLPLAPCIGKRRLYSAQDLELILVAHRLQTATVMRYSHLRLLVRVAQSEGRDVVAWLRTLLDQARSDRPGFALSEQRFTA